MAQVVFGLNMVETIVFLSIVGITILSSVIIIALLLHRLDVAQATIASLRDKISEVTAKRIKTLRECKKQTEATNQVLLKELSGRNTNVVIENY